MSMVPAESLRHDAADYEKRIHPSKLSKLEKHYIVKAKKHNLSPQDLLHVLPHWCGNPKAFLPLQNCCTSTFHRKASCSPAGAWTA